MGETVIRPIVQFFNTWGTALLMLLTDQWQMHWRPGGCFCSLLLCIVPSAACRCVKCDALCLLLCFSTCAVILCGTRLPLHIRIHLDMLLFAMCHAASAGASLQLLACRFSVSICFMCWPVQQHQAERLQLFHTC